MKAGPKLQTRANSGNRAKEDASFGNYYGQILSKLDLYIHMSTKYLIVDQSEPTLVSISFKLHYCKEIFSNLSKHVRSKEPREEEMEGGEGKKLGGNLP